MNYLNLQSRRAVALILGLLLPQVILVTSLPGQSPQTGTLTIKISGVRNTKGKLGLALFSDAPGFPEDDSKMTRRQTVEIDPQTMSGQATFRDIPYGVYAPRRATARFQ